MKFSNKTKILLRTALISSPALGLLVALLALRNIPFSILLFASATLIASFFCAASWVVNSTLTYFIEIKHLKFNNILRYILSYILNIPLVFLLFLILNCFRTAMGDTASTLYNISFLSGLLLNSIIFLMHESISSNDKRNRIEFENTQLKVKNAEAYYQQLKQQIHPHFLFNSLNVLKSLVRRNPDTAVDYIIRLSDFLRTSLSSSQQHTVTLKDELRFCTDYLEMQKLRFDKALEYIIDVPEKTQYSGKLPVFALQLLVENAIKHNSMTDEQPLRINITVENSFITILNNVRPKISTEISTGLGLVNLLERYKILSGDNVVVNRNHDFFSVTLKILDV